MREAGFEPARPEWTLEPESSESTNSTTRAYQSTSIAQISYHRVPCLSILFFNPTNFFRGKREMGLVRGAGFVYDIKKHAATA